MKKPASYINALVLGNHAMTAEMALRLGRYFGTSAEFWMNLQTHYDLETARHNLGRQLSEVTPRTA